MGLRRTRSTSIPVGWPLHLVRAYRQTLALISLLASAPTKSYAV